MGIPAMAVLRELDGHKNVLDQVTAVHQAGSGNAGQAASLTKATLARRALTFLLENLRQRPDLFRGQKSEETQYSNMEARLHVGEALSFAGCLAMV